MPTELVLQTREVLAQRFPACFCRKGTVKKPLKVGVRQELVMLCEDIPADLIHKALTDYCRGPSYQVALRAGAPRYDLYGNVSGEVTEREAALAQTRLNSRPRDVVERWMQRTGQEVPEKINPAEACAATG